jgi:ribonuclease HI
MKGIDTLHVEGDSQLVVDLMNGKIRAKKRHIAALYRKAKELADGFTEFGRARNARADGLANEAMTLRVNRVWARETGQ